MGSDRPKSPVIAALLSGLMPGLGQLYCREWVKGVARLGAMSVVDYGGDVSKAIFDVLVNHVVPESVARLLVASTLMLAIAGWSVFDAVRTAKRSSL